MKEISDDGLKVLQLDIMQKIHCFCKSNSISYFLAYGTLIGAIRHNGYIPWDDDIDIMMLRPDYDRFIKTFNGFTKNLEVIAPELNPEYYAPYANVFDNRTVLSEDNINHRGIQIGVKIDIFPLDAVSTSQIKQKIDKGLCRCFNALMLNKKLSIATAKKQGSSRFIFFLILRFLTFFIPYSICQKCIICIAKSNNWENAEYVDNIATGINETAKSKLLFSKPIEHRFENFSFYIPNGYDEYLRDRYGDYMKLPPISDQMPHHGFKAYWK